MVRWIGTAAAAVVVVAGVSLGISGRLAPVRTPDAVQMAVEEAPVESADAVSDELTSTAVTAVQEYDGIEKAVLQSDGAAGSAEPYETEGEMAIMAEAAEEPLQMMDAESMPPASACEFSIGVEDVEAACERIRDLAQEYESEAEFQPIADGGAKLYLEIDADYASDFLGAVARMDVDDTPDELPEPNGEGKVLVLLWVNAVQ